MKVKTQKNISTIDVRDIIEVLEQHNFPNQKQYPQDLCGILHRKVRNYFLTDVYK
jgi:hypothetical protein